MVLYKTHYLYKKRIVFYTTVLVLQIHILLQKKNYKNFAIMKLNKTRLMELANVTNLKESSYTKVTKDMWANMSEDQQADALLSAAEDPDQAESFIGSEWEALPPQITSNMHMYKAGNASIIGMHANR